MEKAYAQAVQSILAKGTSEKEVADSLIAHLKTTGRIKLLPRILHELSVQKSKRATFAPRVEVASEKEAATALSEARAEGIDATETHVNPALIRGWRARKGSMLVDRSAKRALIDLYRRIAS